jgi:hypothetical protein
MKSMTAFQYQVLVKPDQCRFWSVFSCDVPRVLPPHARAFGDFLLETHYMIDRRVLGCNHLSSPAWGGQSDITLFNTHYGNALNASSKWGIGPGVQWGVQGPSGFTGKRWNERENRHERDDKCYLAVPVVWSNFSHLVAEGWSQPVTIEPFPDYAAGERPQPWQQAPSP